MTDDGMEVYIYRGKYGERVSETVQKLIVEEGVEELPDQLCDECGYLREVSLSNGLKRIGDNAFSYCGGLVKIAVICNTAQVIGKNAFLGCYSLAEVEFDPQASSAQELRIVDGRAFYLCTALQRIKLPSSVTFVGRGAYGSCDALIEANLSNIRTTNISDQVFHGCESLKTVSLPNTLERIGHSAFSDCYELVTVMVPFDSHSIEIGGRCFQDCVLLSNFILPKDSTAEDNSFDGCLQLCDRYGDDSACVLKGLVGRFNGLPIHRLCYDISLMDVKEFAQCIEEHREGDFLVDEFGMTPFHVLFSAVEPSAEALDVLLESIPYQSLNCHDASGKRPLDYLFYNWNDGMKRLLHSTLQKWIVDPLARWGAISWMEAIENKVQVILAEDCKEQRTRLCDEAYSAFEHYENITSISILEMALWKGKLKSAGINDSTKRQTFGREECRFLSGSDVVIPHVAVFLRIR